MMLRRILNSGLYLLLCVPSLAQNDHPLRFDAAVIKPYVRDPAMKTLMGQFTGGPGGKDPGRVSWGQVALRTLISEAFGIRNAFDISGPRWIDNPYWVITATYPPNTTRDEFRKMEKSLLSDRFHLAAHVETKLISGLEMTVPPTGLKISPTTDAGFATLPPGARLFDPDGFPLLRAGLPFAVTTGGDTMRMTFRQVTMSFLARTLNDLISGGGERFYGPTASTIFIDNTGLTDQFNFHLEISGNAEVGVGIASISQAVEKQLGLRLHATKKSVDRLVVDHVDPAPTPN